MLRYADDFVIVSNDLEVLYNIKNAIEEFLRVRGLELSPWEKLVSYVERWVIN